MDEHKKQNRAAPIEKIQAAPGFIDAFEVTPYGYTLYLYNDKRALAKDKRGLTLKFLKDCAGVTHFDGPAIIIGVFDQTLDTVVHECTHACVGILHTVGIPIKPKTDEAITWLNAWMVVKVLKSLQRHQSMILA